jgi:hypothetical protein
MDQGKEEERKVLGNDKRVVESVGLLRKTMCVYGMAPERPADWVDPYAIKEKVQERVTDSDSALKLVRHRQDKAMSLIMQAHLLKTNAKKAKRKMPDWVDHQFPLMNVVEPKDGDIKFLPREEALKLGERGGAAKRQRLGPRPQPTQPRQVRERPAETITSRALEAEKGEIIQRTVYFVTNLQTTQESDMIGLGTFRPGYRRNLAGQESAGQPAESSRPVG